MAESSETWPQTVMSRLSDKSPEATDAGKFTHINSQIKDAVGYTNENVTNFASKETVIPYDIMVSQSAGQVSQAAAQYMDGVMQITLASQSILMKKLVEDVASGNVKGAAEDGIGIAGLEALMSMALAVGAGTGVIEGAGAAKAVELMDSKLNTYMTTVNNSMSSGGSSSASSTDESAKADDEKPENKTPTDDDDS